MRGYFVIHREDWNNPVLQTREPLTLREAWIWLNERAAFKPNTIRVGSRSIPLQRGQLTGSYRSIANAWGWDHNRVRRFMNDLANAEMVAIKTDGETGQTIITVCNYGKNGRDAEADETPGETAKKSFPRTGTRTHREEEEKILNTKEKEDAPFGSESRAPASPAQPSQQVELLMPLNGGVSASTVHSNKGGKRNGKTGIPVDWSPSDDDLEYARRAGLDDSQIADQVERYRNYEPPPRKQRLTWRRWVDLIECFDGHRGGSPHGTKRGPEDITAVVNKLMSRRRMEAS